MLATLAIVSPENPLLTQNTDEVHSDQMLMTASWVSNNASQLPY